VWLFSEMGHSILSHTDEMLQMVDPHRSTGIACVDGHADVVDEQEVVPQEDSV
jgi:hypothetical protein